jgi:hypothetical protein
VQTAGSAVRDSSPIAAAGVGFRPCGRTDAAGHPIPIGRHHYRHGSPPVAAVTAARSRRTAASASS